MSLVRVGETVAVVGGKQQAPVYLITLFLFNFISASLLPASTFSPHYFSQIEAVGSGATSEYPMLYFGKQCHFYLV